VTPLPGRDDDHVRDLAPPLAVVAASLLVAYLSLFPAFFAVLVVRFVRVFGPIGLLLASPAWVASELGRQYVWDGFPWELLGYSQVTWLPIAQLASVVGVYGLSALLALSASVVALAS
jgi:apolipoprotein N-acyltransferase